MRQLRKSIVAGLVWATATSTLMASTPFILCRCPNGDVRIFGSASTAAKSPCCNVTCCPSDDGAKSCCCHKNASGNNTVQNQGTGVKNSGDGPIFVKASCQKALVQVDASALNQQYNKLTQSPTEHLHLQCETACGISAVMSIPYMVIWRVDRLPPPTDLVTSLQRLII